MMHGDNEALFKITNRCHPIGVMLPLNNFPALLTLADEIKKTLQTGIQAGLADAEAGKMHELTDDYIASLMHTAEQRIKNKPTK